MKVGFYTAYGRDPVHLLHAVGLVESVKRAMPGVPVVQFTDDVTPEVPGVSKVLRLPSGNSTERRLQHYAELEGPWLLVDTDVLFLEDVRGSFDQPADIAVTDRNWPWLPQGDAMMHTMPYNMGVIFMRGAAQFWKDVLNAWIAMPESERDFLSDQRALYSVIRSGKYRVQILPGAVYNYPPKSADDPLEGVAIAHYKGFRKAWLSERIAQGWRIPAVAEQ